MLTPAKQTKSSQAVSLPKGKSGTFILSYACTGRGNDVWAGPNLYSTAANASSQMPSFALNKGPLCSDVPRRYQQTRPLAGDIQEELLMHQLTYGHHFPVLVSLLSQTRAPEFAFFFLPGNLLLYHAAGPGGILHLPHRHWGHQPYHRAQTPVTWRQQAPQYLPLIPARGMTGWLLPLPALLLLRHNRSACWTADVNILS